MTKDFTLRETVFRAFLRDPNLGPREMKDALGANYNSIKAIYAKLCDEGLLQRKSRGNYTPNLPRILLHLMERVVALEKSGK